MSGRFTFTAGNTLTAAQLNTNVMDGIPYKIVAGEASVTTSATATWSTGTVAVTFASSFTSGVVPVVIPGVRYSNGNQATMAQAYGVSYTGFTMRATTYANTAATIPCPYIAFQMTSTTGIGNS